MLNYHDRRFIPVSNTANGEVSPEVVFHYQQTGLIVMCRYSGGRIVSGQLIALVDAEGCLDMRYHPMIDRGEGMTGVCRSTPELLPDGRIRLHEAWRWTSGDGSSGSSVVVEVTNELLEAVITTPSSPGPAARRRCPTRRSGRR